MAAGLGFKTFTTGEVLTAADTNGYLMQGVLVFASSAARAAAITSPQEGQYSYLKDTNSTEYYDGAAWIAAPIGDITGVTAGTGISGGGTSGTVTITNSMATEITAKGDLIVGTGSATFDNLPVGTNGMTIVADSTASTGLKWATAAATSGPTFSAYPTGTNQTIPQTTFTKILFDTEAWDTAGNFASSRFTPTTAGYYQINATVYFIGLNAANDAFQIWKNGATYFEFKNVNTGNLSINISQVVYFNGSTDYLEVYMYKNGAGSATVQSGQAYTNFNGVWIRS